MTAMLLSHLAPGRRHNHFSVWWKWNFTRVLLLAGMFQASSFLAAAQGSVTLAWDPSPSTNVVGYRIYYGGASRTYTNVVLAGNLTTAVVSNLVGGATYFFAATAFDSVDNESEFSTEISHTVSLSNTAPTISGIANQAIAQDTSTAALAFTVGDGQTPAGDLTVSGMSSNPTLVPNGNIILGGSGANRTVMVTPAVGQVGTATITLNVSDGALSASTSFGLTVSALPSNGLSFAASSGAISAPFVSLNGVVSQAIRSGVSDGGRAVYRFTVPAAGDYVVSMMVGAPDEGRNSLYVNIDGEPSDPTMIWDVPVTGAGFTNAAVGWRGNDSDSRHFGPKIFALTAGEHHLIIRGREADTRFATIGLSLAPEPKLSIAVSPTGGGLMISWSSPSTAWILEESKDFLAPRWTVVTAVPEDDGRKKRLVVSPVDASALYRLRQL